MPSGERIQFANNVNFIFECHSLQYASPATVSRCGMLLMSHQHNDIQNILAVWLAAQPAEQTGESTHTPASCSHSTHRLEDPLQTVTLYCACLCLMSCIALVSHRVSALACPAPWHQSVEHVLAGLLQQWLQSAFLPALKVVQSHGQVVDTPLVTLVRNALSHLVGVGSKHDLACGLFHGLGANLDEAGRHKLTAEIGRLTGEPNVLSSAGPIDPSAALRSQPHLVGGLAH